ncbi:MAG: transcription elongation factor GreA [Patescibacteria group bacterium]
MSDKIQYLTADGLAALKKELQEIKDTRIPEIAARIDEAKQQGDLSENAEYHQAKDDMAWAQGRLRQLQYILDNAQVVESSGKNKETVIVGSTVVVKINENTKTYTIVGPQEANPLEGRISNESPLGGSFIGRKIGDKVEVQTPAGTQIYLILEIK